MNIQYEPKTNGYLIAHRSLQNLLNSGNMSFTTLGAYICFSFQADWDRKHKYYKAIKPNDNDLSKIWGCSKSAISRNRKNLIKKGLLEKIDQVTYVKNLDLFKIHTINAITKANIANVHDYYAKSENDLAEMLMNVDKMHKNEPEL